ncbi:MAG TPA: 50S ribosomal protein L25 [Kofleriaceae bacterium]|jgi:large subunit ribosomal protein L25
MEVGKLTVQVRNTTGHKGASRALRTAGNVPGVCYGASVDGRIEPLSIVVNVKALKAALDPVKKQNTVIDLTVEGGTTKHQLHALVKEYQLHPLRREITHVDLLAIDPNKEVTANVPLEFVGKPKGTVDGGMLRIVMRALEVRAKPNDLPTKLSVDVTPLGIGDVIHVSDIAIPNGVSVTTGRDLAVVTCSKPEEDAPVAAEAEAAVAGAAPAAGAAAAPAAGAKAAAPAAGGKAAAPAAGKAAAPAAKAPAKK